MKDKWRATVNWTDQSQYEGRVAGYCELDWSVSIWRTSGELLWTGLISLNMKDKWRATVNNVVILWVSHSPGKFCDSLRNCGFSRRAQLHAVILNKSDDVIRPCSARFIRFVFSALEYWGTAVLYKSEGRGFDSRWCHWKFLLSQPFRPHYGPGNDSDSNRNEYQEYFLGVKAAGV